MQLLNPFCQLGKFKQTSFAIKNGNTTNPEALKNLRNEKGMANACNLTASLVTYFPWVSLVPFVTCCPNFSLPLFVRKTSAFSYLSKNSFILLFSSATQRVLERRVPFSLSADYHRKKSFSVLCSSDRGHFTHLRTLEN